MYLKNDNSTIGMDEFEARDKLSTNGLLLRYINNKTYDDCLNAIKQNCWAFKHVPKEFQKLEIVKYVVEQNSLLLRFFKNYDDQEALNFCLQKSPSIISYLKNPTEENIKMVINLNPSNIRLVDSKFITEDIFRTIIYQLEKDPSLINKVQNPSPELIKDVLEINQNCFKHIKSNRYSICAFYDVASDQVYNLFEEYEQYRNENCYETCYGEEYGEQCGEECGEQYGEEYGEQYGEEYGEQYNEEYVEQNSGEYVEVCYKEYDENGEYEVEYYEEDDTPNPGDVTNQADIYYKMIEYNLQHVKLVKNLDNLFKKYKNYFDDEIYPSLLNMNDSEFKYYSTEKDVSKSDDDEYLDDQIEEYTTQDFNSESYNNSDSDELDDDFDSDEDELSNSDDSDDSDDSDSDELSDSDNSDSDELSDSDVNSLDNNIDEEENQYISTETNTEDNTVIFVKDGDESYGSENDQISEKVTHVHVTDNVEVEGVEESYVHKVDSQTSEKSETKEPVKAVYYENIKTNSTHVSKNSESVEDAIHDYIKKHYGSKCLHNAINHFNKASTIDEIMADASFDEGIFYLRNINGKYEMYKKSTTYVESGVIFTYKNAVPKYELIRIYSTIEL
ncbi:hypothetical protein KY334_02090 [Candidatus Woesearchaeota archaeon]|nr:hypothetical protein [Candidatus Woesearchaeota archaeon]